MPAASFVVPVRDLINRPGEQRELDLDVPAPFGWMNPVIAVPEGENVHADVRLESLHDGILVTADIDTIAKGECVRCLIDIEQPVEVEIQELFAYSSEGALDYEIHGDHVDLESAARDAAVLSLPFQPVCQDDCPGLCPQCGVRLLDEPDHEHEAPVDPRWSALQTLADPHEDPGADPGATRK